jgi:hypothetical protein
MIDINFLSQRRITLTKVEEGDKKTYLLSIAFFAISMAIFIIVFGTKIFFQNSIKKSTQTQKAIQQMILDEEPTEVAFLIFSNKLKTIKDLFENRSDKQEAIGFFSELFGPNVFIGGMEYNEKDSILSLKSTSSNIFELEKTFNLLNDNSVKEKFSSLEKTSLSRKDDGGYSFQLLVGLKKEANDTKK